MSADLSLGVATACIRCEVVLRSQLAAVASTMNTELGGAYTWVDAVLDRAIETMADHEQPVMDWPTLRLIPNAPVHKAQVSGREKSVWDLILVALVREHDKEGGTNPQQGRTMALRAVLLARAAELVLRTPATGLIGTTGVWQIEQASAGFVRPFDDKNTLGYEKVLRVSQFVHDPF